MLRWPMCLLACHFFVDVANSLFSTFMIGNREDVQMTCEEVVNGLRTLHPSDFDYSNMEARGLGTPFRVDRCSYGNAR